jgi:molybdenum cofactor guanylyltransferase
MTEMPGTRACGVAGILLTGGASRRMGFDKARLSIDGVPNAARLAAVLKAVVAPTVEVGPGVSGLPAIQEVPAGAGPLVAMCAGARHLRSTGHDGPVLVLACDLPFMSSDVISELCAWVGDGSVVPVVAGRAQPLCARWSQNDLRAAEDLVVAGERSMRSLLGRRGITFPDESEWRAKQILRAFADADSPADLKALGLSGMLEWRAHGGDDEQRFAPNRPS